MLVSARDPGSAHQAAAFVRATLARDLSVMPSLVGYGAAVPILSTTGLPVVVWPQNPNASRSLVTRTANRFLEDSKADVVLCGLAYPGYGPDEALFDAAERSGVPSACIQDYWGYVGGFKRNKCPSVFFVHDRLASKLTRQRVGTSTRCVVVGSPRHAETAGETLRVYAGVRPTGRPLVVFFGQPLTFPGCRDNLQRFVDALAEIPGPIAVRFRRHPNDVAAPDFYTALFARQPHSFQVSPVGQPLERDLLEANLIVTCFSSVGLDQHYLQLHSRRHLAPVLFITIGADIRRLLRAQVGIPAVPNVILGLATGVNRVRDLVPALRRLLYTPAAAARQRRRIKQRLAGSTDPSALIARHLLNLVTKSK